MDISNFANSKKIITSPILRIPIELQKILLRLNILRQAKKKSKTLENIIKTNSPYYNIELSEEEKT